MNHPEQFTKTTPNHIVKWVLKERQQRVVPIMGNGFKRELLPLPSFCSSPLGSVDPRDLVAPEGRSGTVGLWKMCNEWLARGARLASDPEGARFGRILTPHHSGAPVSWWGLPA